MNKDLKNLLEEERSGVLTIGDRILVNKVLDLVEKEVREETKEKGILSIYEILTIINNLRV